MSTENNAVTARTFGFVEREANDTVIFTSEQGRRIRFRYSRMSPQYPGAAQYQCVQCPVIALMVNAKFCIVDPCAGHDCSVGTWAWALNGGSTCRSDPQWTPPTDDATTAVSAQQSPATTALASHLSHPTQNATKIIDKAVYDANGCIQWRSERYPGITFTFRPRKDVSGSGRRYFCCLDCRRKCDKYTRCLSAFGIERRCLVVLGENIVDLHPDSAGTNQGHLCQQPHLEEKLKAKALERARAKARASSAPKTQMFGEPSTKASNDRARSLAKRPAASSAESHEDKTFGKVITVQASTLTEAEKLAWSSSPIIKTGPMRGKELIAYRSRKLSRKFHFLLAGPSSLDKHAYDYYCLGCWNNHREDCRVTVRSSTQDFVVTDPDRTSAGRHACIEASSPRPSGLLALAKEPLSGLADDEAESLQHDVAETPARSIEYFSKRYQAKLKFSLKEQGKNGQAYYVCWKCRTLQRKLKETGYRHSGYTECRMRLAVVVGGKFMRHPDECGVELFMGDTVERRHICQDDKLKKLMDVDRAVCDDGVEPSPKRMRDAAHVSPSGSRALTSIRMQSTRRPKTDTRTPDDSQQTSIDQRAWAQTESSRPMDCAADQVIREQATTAGNDESSRQREVLQYPGSVRSDGDHLTVQYTPASGMILNTTHASAQMTFLDFRQIFKIPQSTQKLFIFKRNDEEWDVIRDDEKGLPVFNGCVEAKAYSED